MKGSIHHDGVLDETRVRLDAIHYARTQRDRWVAVPAGELQTFESGGRRIFLKGQQGIFKPVELSEPLSIRSALDSPYNDGAVEGTRVLYDFAPKSREHENDGLKRCAESELPLIYLLQVKRKPNPEYVVFAPVYVVGWDDGARSFLVDLSEERPGAVVSPVPVIRQMDLAWATRAKTLEIRELTKSYVVTTVQRRLHQAKFRNQVLDAYRERCAVCILHVRPLLDAAHVVPDIDPKPVIEINEGLALCATHHRAFDAKILRYDDEFRVRVELPERAAVGEGEKTMLLAFDGRPLTLPSDERWWPVPMRT